MAVRAVEVPAARVVRGYELREPVRIGATSMVYRAWQPSVQRPVLVRVIPPELVRRPDMAAAFEAEALRIARLEHPHILPLYDYWQDETGAYVVARWLPHTLRDALEQGLWPLDAALRLAEQIALALDAAHQAKIVHHSVAPDLVLLDESGNAYLAGFVMSRLLSGGTNGEPAPGPYAAPEQRAGQPATPPTDLYSLGMLVYEVLTGTAPDLAGDDLPPLRTFQPGLPAALDPVLQTATSREPAHRYSDGRRFAAALRAAAAPSGKAQPLVDPLTERELDILGLMVQGRDNSAIADQLVLSTSTVKWYVKQIYSKLDAHNRDEAVDRARALGLAGEPEAVAAVLPPQPQAQPLPRQSLPAFGLPFIGRERALADLAALLAQPAHPLITLVAPGGMGKTRLAVEAARAATADFPDGVIYVPLTAAHEAQFADALSKSLGILIAADQPLWSQIIAYAGPRRLLLLLDNFESVIGAARELADLLRAAPRIRALVTSRERLRLEEETVYVLGGMETPLEGDAPPAMLESMRLFIERARRVRFGFAVDDASLRAIAEICRLVDGMPLALVLAASWAEVLAPAEIAAEIRASREFLAAEYADLPERQRSVRVVFESAWERLKEQERQVFARLSVFRGGFTRSAAAAVAGATLPSLAGLLTKALIWTDESGRYGIHELLRQFAAERLTAAGEADTLREAHSRTFLEWAAHMEAEICGPNPTAALELVGADWHNLRDALMWAAEHGRPEWITPTWKTLWLYHEGRARLIAGSALFEETAALLKRLPESAERNDALGMMYVGSSFVAEMTQAARRRHALLEQAWSFLQKTDRPELLAYWYLDRGSVLPYTESKDLVRYLQEALDRFLVLGDRWGQIYARCYLYWAGAFAGDPEATQRFLDHASEFQSIARDTGDLHIQSLVMNTLGYALGQAARPGEAIACFAQAAALSRVRGDHKRETSAMCNAAIIYMQVGALDSALALQEAAIAIRRELMPSVCICYEDHGETYLRKGEFEQARPLFLDGQRRVDPEAQPIWQCIYLLYRVRLAYCLGQWDDLRGLVREMQAFAAESGEAHKLHFALATQVYGAFARGDEDEARAALADLEQLAEGHDPVIAALASVVRAELMRRGGDPASAASALRVALAALETGDIEPIAAGWEDCFTPLQVRGFLVRALLDCGDTDEAWPVALAALEKVYASKAPPFVLAALLVCARVAAAVGDRVRAAETAALIAASPLAFASDRLMAAALEAELPAAPVPRALDWEQAAAEWLALAE